jgi:tetratricopeptide (TPR) repeat protein
MAPEQRQGKAADARSDQYSFCVALYEALSGERPSEKEEPGFPPGDKRTPVFIQRILSRGLDPNRDRRFPDMSALLSELSWDPRQKRRRVMAVLAVIFFLVLLVSGAYLGIQSDTQKCKDAGQAVLSAWNPARKATVRRVFLASGTVFARDAADVVENQLDRFSADWTAMHAEACEATHLRGELSETFLDARLFCLRRRLDEVKALVDVFEQAGNVVIGDAVSAVHDLNNLQDCEDVPALLARQALPRDEKARALVEEQQSRISRVQALLHTGQYAEGLALAEDIVEDIEGTTYKPLEAEAMFMQGRLQHKTGDLQAGEKSMYKALWAAEAGHHDTLAARAWTELVLLVGYELARHEEGHRLYKHARAAVDRAGRPAEIEATLLFYAGRIFLAEAKWKQAADLFQKAEERFRKAVRSDHPLLAMIINSRGTVHYFKGEYDKTSKCYLKSLAIRQRVFGQRHPEVGKSYNNLGNVLTARDKYEEALESYEKALDNYQQSLEPNHSHIAHVRTNIGLALMDLGRYEKAIKHHQFAVEALSRSLGEDHPKVAVALNSLGLAWLRMGRHNEAIESLERSRKITINKYGTDHPNVAMALRNLGMAYGDLGKQETAIKNLQEALRINTKSYGPEHINLSYLQYDIGSLLFRQGKLQPALEKFLIALDLHERTSGKDNPCHYVWLLHRIALVYNRLGQTAEAKQYVERALTLEKTVLSDSIDLASARFRLAKLLRKLGTDRERAKDLAVKAKTVFVKAGSGHSADLKEVTEWLEKHR